MLQRRSTAPPSDAAIARGRTGVVRRAADGEALIPGQPVVAGASGRRAAIGRPGLFVDRDPESRPAGVAGASRPNDGRLRPDELGMLLDHDLADQLVIVERTAQSPVDVDPLAPGPYLALATGLAPTHGPHPERLHEWGDQDGKGDSKVRGVSRPGGSRPLEAQGWGPHAGGEAISENASLEMLALMSDPDLLARVVLVRDPVDPRVAGPMGRRRAHSVPQDLSARLDDAEHGAPPCDRFDVEPARSVYGGGPGSAGPEGIIHDLSADPVLADAGRCEVSSLVEGGAIPLRRNGSDAIEPPAFLVEPPLLPARGRTVRARRRSAGFARPSGSPTGSPLLACARAWLLGACRSLVRPARRS